MTFTTPKFSIGQIVRHRLFEYRGVIFEIDPCFHGPDEEWYRNLEGPPPPKDEPWYHMLVDGTTRSSYVPERDLEIDTSGGRIKHPMLDRLFDDLADGRYQARHPQGLGHSEAN